MYVLPLSIIIIYPPHDGDDDNYHRRVFDCLIKKRYAPIVTTKRRRWGKKIAHRTNVNRRRDDDGMRVYYLQYYYCLHIIILYCCAVWTVAIMTFWRSCKSLRLLSSYRRLSVLPMFISQSAVIVCAGGAVYPTNMIHIITHDIMRIYDIIVWRKKNNKI